MVISFILLLYVDDIVLTCCSPPLVAKFISVLSSHFAMNDLGDLHYFLGVQIVRSPSGLFLSQHEYVCYLLCKSIDLHIVKPVSTLVGS